MTATDKTYPLLQGLNKNDFNIESIADEIRVDTLCSDLLRHLYHELTEQRGLSPEQAGGCCHGADYFLREYIIGDRRENLFTVKPLSIRQFAGHWYIVHAMDPALSELKGMLSGVAEFYSFLARQGMVSEAAAAEIFGQCREHDYYQQRIEDFWSIEGDGYLVWRQACPLPKLPDKP